MFELINGVEIDTESDLNNVNIGYFEGVEYATGSISFILNEHICFNADFSSEIEYQDDTEEVIDKVKFTGVIVYDFIDTDVFGSLDDYILSVDDMNKAKSMIELEIKRVHAEGIEDYKTKKEAKVKREVFLEKWIKTQSLEK